jgi:hypothetical protein
MPVRRHVNVYQTSGAPSSTPTHLQQFSDDFTKKIASGNVIGFDAKLIAYTGVIHESNDNDTIDFWGNPVKKDTINIRQKPSVKKTSDFWNQ